MTRITVRYSAPISQYGDAPGARPKTLDLAGDRYARIEQQPADAESNFH